MNFGKLIQTLHTSLERTREVCIARKIDFDDADFLQTASIRFEKKNSIIHINYMNPDSHLVKCIVEYHEDMGSTYSVEIRKH